MKVLYLVATKVGSQHELLFNKPASDSFVRIM